jgi:Zn-dependent protease with chaperone function
VEKMKKRILTSVFCLALLSLALPVLAAPVNINLGLNQIGNEIGLPQQEPTVVAARIINVALGFLGIVAVVIVLYGGFMWMTAGGNEERVTKAKQILTAGVIGLVIIIMAWAIARFVVGTLMNVAG